MVMKGGCCGVTPPVCVSASPSFSVGVPSLVCWVAVLKGGGVCAVVSLVFV